MLTPLSAKLLASKSFLSRLFSSKTEISLFLLASSKPTFALRDSMTLKIKKTCPKWLQKHRNRRKIIKAKVLPVKTTHARASARAVARAEFSIRDQCRKSDFAML